MCPQLLQESVVIGLRFLECIVDFENHEIIPILKANNALTVGKLFVDLAVFSGEGSPKFESLIEFLKIHEIHNTVKEVFIGVTKREGITDKLFELLSVLPMVTKLRLDMHELYEATEYSLNVKELWKDTKFSSIQSIELDKDNSHTEFKWTTAPFTLLRTIVEHMPNLKSITNIYGYDEKFFNDYAPIIKMDFLRMSDVTYNIINTKNLIISDTRIDGFSEYDCSKFLACLVQNHPELVKLCLVYYCITPTVPLCDDYSKVTELELSIDSEEFGDLQDFCTIMNAFPNASRIQLSATIVGTCFFGHNIVPLPSLTEFTLYLHNSSPNVNCHECITAWTKSVASVTALKINFVSLSLINSISSNMMALQKLTIIMNSKPKEDIIALWPEMLTLKSLSYEQMSEVVKLQDIRNLFKKCPKLRHLCFERCITIQNY